MLTLSDDHHAAGDSATCFATFTGGYDGIPGVNVAPLFGYFDYDLYGHTYYLYCLAVLFVVFLCRAAHRLFAVRRGAGRHPRERRAHACARLAGAWPSRRRPTRSRPAIAGIAGALFAQTNAYVTLGVLDFDQSAGVLVMLILGGAGWLYGAFVGAVLYMVLQDYLAKISPEFWQFGIGLVLIAVGPLGPPRQVRRGWTDLGRFVLGRMQRGSDERARA